MTPHTDDKRVPQNTPDEIDEQGIIVTCSNCYQERTVNPSRLGIELKEFYNQHKTRIGRIGCKYDNLCVRYELVRKALITAARIEAKKQGKIEGLRLVANAAKAATMINPKDTISISVLHFCQAEAKKLGYTKATLTNDKIEGEHGGLVTPEEAQND